MGCDYAQGYLFSKPKKLEQLLTDNHLNQIELKKRKKNITRLAEICY
jgi:EAL domain-containing protein (putative c-di-GMP-specific phosphodiesterase class I)